MSQHPLQQFARETEMTEAERARYERMLRVRAAELGESSGRSWFSLPVGLTLAGAAAAGLFAVNTLGPAEPRPLAMTLEGPAAQATLTEHVRLRYAGQATVSGTDQAPNIELASGRVEVDVDPGLGIQLRVRTPEAEVKVLGTVFSVERSPLGSEIQVQRGRVGVSCADGSEQVLEAGQTHTCLPTDAAGLLGRSRALQAAGAPPLTVLASADAGLAAPELDPGTRGELTFVRLEALTATQSYGLALEAAQAYLASGETGRRPDALEAAARLSLLSGGCAASEPFVAELEASGQQARVAEVRTRCPAP